MANERLGIPTDDAYVTALGLATVAFARLEWDVVWCCERRLKPGYIKTIKKKTAGQIASDFLRFIAAIPDAEERRLYSVHGDEFKRLVEVRNGIMHGKPGTTKAGEQRLYRDGGVWTLDALHKAADEFVLCGRPINRLLHTPPEVKP